MIGIIVPSKDRHFPYFACFDFECNFDTVNLPKNGPQLTFESNHVTLSFAISSNVPRFQSGVCHVTDGNEANLINEMVTRLEEISDAAYDLLKNKFQYVFEAFYTNQNCKSCAVCSSGTVKNGDRKNLL